MAAAIEAVGTREVVQHRDIMRRSPYSEQMTTPEIDRKVRGTMSIKGKARGDGWTTTYSPLTIEEIEKFCIEARVHGASGRSCVTVDDGGVYRPASLTVDIPANFEVIPDVPNAGKNARLNRRMAWIALAATAVAATMVIALVTFLLV